MQNHYNLLYREEEREMNKYCKATGVGLIPCKQILFGTQSTAASSLQTHSLLHQGHPCVEAS